MPEVEPAREVTQRMLQVDQTCLAHRYQSLDACAEKVREEDHWLPGKYLNVGSGSGVAQGTQGVGRVVQHGC